MGLPKGATSDKEWRSEIRKAVHELRSVPGENGAQPQKVRTLRLLARKLADRGLEGEIAALREIGDRLDGKPAQAIAIKGDPDSPVIFNLRLGDGMVDGGQAEVSDALGDAAGGHSRAGWGRGTRGAGRAPVGTSALAGAPVPGSALSPTRRPTLYINSLACAGLWG